MQHSVPCRAISALLAATLALLPALSAAAKKPSRTTVTVAPYAALGGVSASLASKATKLIAGELRGRDELKLAEAAAEEPREEKPRPAHADWSKLHDEARAALQSARELGDSGHHDKAAEALASGVAALQSKPAAVDAEGGALLRELLLRLAAERLSTSDEDGGDAALAALVRLSPDASAPMGSFPPAFLREFGAVQRRTLGQARGSLRVEASAGDAEARVFLDGRVVHAAPVLIKDVLPGEHFVRVERAREVWAERVTVLPAAEATLTAQLGEAPQGEASELQAALRSGVLDGNTVAKAAQLAKDSGAQAVIFGVVLREGDGFAVRSFAYLAKADKLQQLARMVIDAEMLGGSLEVLRLSDDAVAKLAAPTAEPLLPLQLGAPGVVSGVLSAALAEVSAAPPAPAAEPAAVEPERKPAAVAASSPAAASGLILPALPAVPGLPELPSVPDEAPRAQAAPPAVPVAAAAPASIETARAVVKPGEAPAAAPAAVKREAVLVAEPAAPAVPTQAIVASTHGRDLVIPRSATGLADASAPPAQLERPREAQVPTRHLEAVDRAEVVAREEPKPAKNHTVLWIVAGALAAGALGTGGYLLWQGSRTPTTATINASWTH